MIREFLRPGGAHDETHVKAHLAHCDRCSAEASRARELEQLWAATAPAEVPAEAWDQVWAGVRSELSRSPSGDRRHPLGLRVPSAADPAAVRPPVGSSRWRSFAVIGMVGLAQAAALILAVGLAWRSPAGDPGLPASPRVPSPAVAVHPSLDSEFDLEDGQVALIVSEGRQVRMIDLTEPDSPNGEDPWFVFFNRVESTSAVVAMAE